MVLTNNWYCGCSEISSYSCVSFSCLMEIHLKHRHMLFLFPIIKPALKIWSVAGWIKNRCEWVSQTFPCEADNCWADMITDTTGWRLPTSQGYPKTHFKILSASNRHILTRRKEYFEVGLALMLPCRKNFSKRS